MFSSKRWVVGIKVSSTARSLKTAQFGQGRGNWGRNRKELGVAFVRDPSEHSPGAVLAGPGIVPGSSRMRVHREIRASLNIEVMETMTVKGGEYGAALEFKCGGNRETPRKPVEQRASSGSIPTYEYPGATPPGIEPVSLCGRRLVLPLNHRDHLLTQIPLTRTHKSPRTGQRRCIHELSTVREHAASFPIAPTKSITEQGWSMNCLTDFKLGAYATPQGRDRKKKTVPSFFVDNLPAVVGMQGRRHCIDQHWPIIAVRKREIMLYGHSYQERLYDEIVVARSRYKGVIGATFRRRLMIDFHRCRNIAQHLKSNPVIAIEPPYDRVKRCRERKINIKASEPVNPNTFLFPLNAASIVNESAACGSDYAQREAVSKPKTRATGRRGPGVYSQHIGGRNFLQAKRKEGRCNSGEMALSKSPEYANITGLHQSPMSLLSMVATRPVKSRCLAIVLTALFRHTLSTCRNSLLSAAQKPSTRQRHRTLAEITRPIRSHQTRLIFPLRTDGLSDTCNGHFNWLKERSSCDAAKRLNEAALQTPIAMSLPSWGMDEGYCLLHKHVRNSLHVSCMPLQKSKTAVCSYVEQHVWFISVRPITGRIGEKETKSSMALIKEPPQHTRGAISKNHGKPETEWHRWESKTSPPDFTAASPHLSIDRNVAETGDHRENPSTSGIVRCDSHLRKSGGRPRLKSNPVRHGGRRVLYHHGPWYDVPGVVSIPTPRREDRRERGGFRAVFRVRVRLHKPAPARVLSSLDVSTETEAIQRRRTAWSSFFHGRARSPQTATPSQGQTHNDRLMHEVNIDLEALSHHTTKMNYEYESLALTSTINERTDSAIGFSPMVRMLVGMKSSFYAMKHYDIGRHTVCARRYIERTYRELHEIVYRESASVAVNSFCCIDGYRFDR
ncbi:hypothetical protein PR048_012260 [Dryococelus australis]|uniref:Ribosomal protein S3 n=1 Tax=Dryococelus australis TaxID=614101 RepID=A0ABQ9HNY4_9NEOP|nr:hypothetical protein PR048_012260 [Dryococelus australis]